MIPRYRASGDSQESSLTRARRLLEIAVAPERDETCFAIMRIIRVDGHLSRRLYYYVYTFTFSIRGESLQGVAVGIMCKLSAASTGNLYFSIIKLTFTYVQYFIWCSRIVINPLR